QQVGHRGADAGAGAGAAARPGGGAAESGDHRHGDVAELFRRRRVELSDAPEVGGEGGAVAARTRPAPQRPGADGAGLTRSLAFLPPHPLAEEAMTADARPGPPPEWTPRMWQGCSFPAWARLLLRNNFAVSPRYAYIPFVVTNMSLMHSTLRLLQESW